MGGPSPDNSSDQPTPAGVPIVVTAIRLEIDKNICQGNYVLVSRFVSKLEQTAPVPIPTLHKMRYPALVRSLLDSTDATGKPKSVLNNLRDSETHATKHFKDPEQFNRPHPVDNLLEKFLNNLQNKKMNVEVRTERVHKTMAMLEERYRNSDEEPIHYQILKV
ncbi:hypothetical protein SARC_08835 [Sphaeroforma arctica JP610]|uniref:Uncharacterized protein n=1 Tax=Sphaeroforma arctica JP610 TaxID=667725 RepID=A0A0L0FPJ8_9EUKA|nr:hypothetical protein SARC_08835 [Sphaeroforma arctica JP610]KNC78740.1 hypothetical protein SARC_08835 [Sphaeroforma arctica JP610]|eukprot:XP_014152642.1 hypothetical protein SARC_08835 [Sphaeroforma arctica JP610]